MAELLYRLGAFAAKRAWVVITAWLLILAVAVGGFLLGSKALTNSFDIPGTASGAVTDALARKLPDFSGAAGTVVFTTKDGSPLTAAQKQGISALVADASNLPDVSQVTDPFATEQQRAAQAKQVTDGTAKIAAARAQLDAGSKKLDAQAHKLALGAQLLTLASDIRFVSTDGSTASVNVAFTQPRLELSESSKQAVVDHFESKKIDGVEVGFSTEISQGVPALFGVGELAGVVFAAVVLLVMLGSILAAAMPIVTALVGVAIGVTGSLAFSGMIQMASVTPVLGVMLGLAVGIDYSLFIINRHRKQLLQGAEVRESVGLANGTAGNAVVFAGSTVIVALLALNVTGVPFLGLMGTVGAICVAVAVLIAISLTPALLGLFGMRILSRRARARVRRHEPGSEILDQATAKPARPMSTLRAIVTVVVGVVALLTLAIPALSMRVGLPDGSTEPVGSASYRAFTVTADKFGPGANSTLLVTADLPAGLTDDQVLEKQVLVAQKLADQKDVVAVAPIAVSDDHKLAAFQVVPKDGPNSVSTEKLVRDLRGLGDIDGDISLGVAGQAAINIDISESLAAVLPLYLTVVVGLSLIIMIMVFRSLLVPLIATGGFILSLFATYGAIVAVFQWGWMGGAFGVTSTGPILSFLPVILIGILFGLAMDYQLFLASGMREAYVHGADARLAVMKGFRAGRSVVIAAGLIMVSVFGGFIFSESTMIRSIGFGLAFGVLIDAFLVRMLLMPALMHLLGRGAWWLPRWLDRIIPNVDIEGAALERRHHVI
ncbi:MMPL family transporter [Diaminobutyricibacter sp. McL0608]|uniref:MMPL family transporter n=1 Tax=Leifsonia sp. McL0608 TaxID=3143537 RepID=UPI0031F2E07D